MADSELRLRDTEPVGDGDHVVEQGESISSIAATTGHLGDTIWQHASNEALRGQRTPGTLLPGDKIFIPPRRQKTVSVEAGRGYRFVVKNRSTDLRLKLFDSDGAPIADERFTLQIGARRIQGQTDGEGVVGARIPVNAASGALSLDRTGETFDLRFGHLDPPDSVTGVQARLNNLGFQSGEVDGDAGPVTREAWLAFLQEIGERDDAEPDAIQQRLAREDPWK